MKKEKTGTITAITAIVSITASLIIGSHTAWSYYGYSIPLLLTGIAWFFLASIVD